MGRSKQGHSCLLSFGVGKAGSYARSFLRLQIPYIYVVLHIVSTKGCVSYRVLSGEVRNRCGCVFLLDVQWGCLEDRRLGTCDGAKFPFTRPVVCSFPLCCYVMTFEVTSGRFVPFPASAPRLEMAC